MLIACLNSSFLQCESHTEKPEIKVSTESKLPNWLKKLIDCASALSAEEIPIDTQHECSIQ